MFNSNLCVLLSECSFLNLLFHRTIMDDDVQAIDPPHSIPPHIQHLNGNAISFVVPDESTSGIPGITYFQI